MLFRGVICRSGGLYGCSVVLDNVFFRKGKNSLAESQKSQGAALVSLEGKKKKKRLMKIVATRSLPAVDRPNADRWNAARSRQLYVVLGLECSASMLALLASFFNSVA